MDLGGNPSRADFRQFESVFQRVREAGLKVTIHCGEVPCGEIEQEEEDPRLRMAFQSAKAILDFGPDRIGHALLLPKTLQSQLDQLQIPVECCPTSNVMTLELALHHNGNLIQGLRGHPQLERWLRTEYPISTSTDDSGVFNTNPTKELLLLAVAWGIDKERLKRMIMSVAERHCFCDHKTRTIVMERIKTALSNL
jgi:adenosine deaminase